MFFNQKNRSFILMRFFLDCGCCLAVGFWQIYTNQLYFFGYSGNLANNMMPSNELSLSGFYAIIEIILQLD
jgi:hypothetical protein